MSIGKKAKKAKALVLTFDDGPGSRLTPAILKVLAENNAKATFFLLGRHIAGHEEIVRRIASQGHEICSHGYDHLNQWKVSPIRAIRDIKYCWQLLDNTLNIKRGKYAFRPPYGKLNLFCLLYLWFHRLPIYYWSYWSLDCGDTWHVHKRHTQSIGSFIKKSGGAVILAHAFDRSDPRKEWLVLESIRLALTMAQKMGMQILTCSQLLGKNI